MDDEAQQNAGTPRNPGCSSHTNSMIGSGGLGQSPMSLNGENGDIVQVGDLIVSFKTPWQEMHKGLRDASLLYRDNLTTIKTLVGTATLFLLSINSSESKA